MYFELFLFYRRSDIETHQAQQTGSNTKRIKPETQTTPLSDQHKEIQEDSITTERSPSPNPQSTPFNKPTTTSGDGFMSARKRTPVKSQSRTTQNRTGRLGISPKRLRIDTQKDAENPLPIISNDNNITNSGCGFISARRRPLVIQPVVETEEKVLLREWCMYMYTVKPLYNELVGTTVIVHNTEVGYYRG